jgi:hypothetical protein
MKFHYEFSVSKLKAPITHHQPVMMIGSCFTENIGELLKQNRFNVLENPNGILFNPASVADAVDSYIHPMPVNESQLFCLNETWHSWKHHSRFSGITAAESVHKINHSVQEANIFLKKAGYLMITLGSAWVYELSDKAAGDSTGKIAANNHKAPADWFTKRLLSAGETTSLLQKMLDQLMAFNPQLQVIFTISPVRHLREGVIENNRSKAVLIQSVHDLVSQQEQCYYFPSYELVIDDLRDYRFYAEDLVHPNYHATQYVWEKFTDACFADSTRQLLKIIREINLAYQHKPFNPSTQTHRQFLERYFLTATQLMNEHPELNFNKELQYFKTGIKPPPEN